MNSNAKKVILNLDMVKKFKPQGLENQDARISKFVVAYKLGLVIFTYFDHHNLYIFSFVQRRMVQVLEVYNPAIKNQGISNAIYTS